MTTNNFSPFDFFICCSHLSKNMHRRSKGVWVRKFYLSMPEKSGYVRFVVFRRDNLHEFLVEIKNDKVITLDLKFNGRKTNGSVCEHATEKDKCQQFVHFLDSLIEWKDVAKEVKGFLTDPTSQKNNWLKTTTVMV